MKNIHAVLKRDIPNKQLRLLWDEFAVTPCPTTTDRYVREISRISANTRNALNDQLLLLEAPWGHAEDLFEDSVTIAYGMFFQTLDICRELNVSYKLSPKNRRLLKRTVFKNRALWARFDHKLIIATIANDRLYEEVDNHVRDYVADISFVLCNNFVILKDFLRYKFQEN